MSPPAMFDLGNSEATGTSRQFGLASSTLLTVLVVIPAIYVVLRDANEVL